MFNESIKNNYSILYDSWHRQRNFSTDGNVLHVDIGSAQQVNSPKYLTAAFQTADRIAAPNKNKNLAIVDKVNVKNCFCEIDGSRYPKDAVLTNFPEIEFLDQYRDLILLFTEYVGEELMNPFINYFDMKNKYPSQVIDLRHQRDNITPNKNQLIEHFNTNAANVNARVFVILIRHGQIKIISDGNKKIENKVI